MNMVETEWKRDMKFTRFYHPLAYYKHYVFLRLAFFDRRIVLRLTVKHKISQLLLYKHIVILFEAKF